VVDQFSSVTVKDPLTVEIVLSSPNLQFPNLFGFYSINWVVSPTAVSASGADFGSKPVGAGPFMLQSRTPNTQTVFVRNPTYWNKPLPYLDQLTIKINPDFQQSIDTLIAGQAQISQQSYRVYSDQAVKAGLQRTVFSMNGGSSVIFNVTKPPFDDVRARQAVSLAINTQGVAQVLYNGADIAPQTLFGRGSPFYDKSLQLPVSHVTSGPNPDAQKLFDQLAAEKAGPLKFSLTGNSSSAHRSTAQAIQTQLASYKNVEVTINQIDPVTFQTKYGPADFQAIFSGSHAVDPEPQMYASYHSGSANNYGKFSDPAMDQALDQGRNGKDLATRQAAYKTFQQTFIKDVPGFFYAQLSPAFTYAKNVTGLDEWGQGVLVSFATIGLVKSKVSK
jgi:peptide/nickel transport system substrate-binding protein